MDIPVDFADKHRIESVRVRQGNSSGYSMDNEIVVSQCARGPVSRAMIGAIHLYQRKISIHAVRSCPFEPSCSHYMVLSIQKYGAPRGVIRGFRRITRCNPFYKGSYSDWP